MALMCRLIYFKDSYYYEVVSSIFHQAIYGGRGAYLPRKIDQYDMLRMWKELLNATSVPDDEFGGSKDHDLIKDLEICTCNFDRYNGNFNFYDESKTYRVIVQPVNFGEKNAKTQVQDFDDWLD